MKQDFYFTSEDIIGPRLISLLATASNLLKTLNNYSFGSSGPIV